MILTYAARGGQRVAVLRRECERGSFGPQQKKVGSCSSIALADV